MIDEKFICERISELRTKRNISARDMSLSIGQNPGYINSIENKKSLPSMQTFLYICDFLEITPQEFFDVENDWSPIIADIVSCCRKLDPDNQEIVLSVANGLNKNGQKQ